MQMGQKGSLILRLISGSTNKSRAQCIGYCAQGTVRRAKSSGRVTQKMSFLRKHESFSMMRVFFAVRYNPIFDLGNLVGLNMSKIKK